MITDEKFINTIKLIALRNALDHDNAIKTDVVISKTFSFSKNMVGIGNIKDSIPDIQHIVASLRDLSLEDKKILYLETMSKNHDYLESNSKSKVDDNKIFDNKKKNAVVALDKEHTFELPKLDDAHYGEVITRFPPEPNGYPHIGHAKAAVIDEEYARKYGGKLILRYDDTNPLKERLEYYIAIKEGLDWLQVKPDTIKNTSDDMEKLYDYGKKLITKNFAYICACRPEKIKKNRLDGIECGCVLNSVNDSLDKFDNMILGKYEQNQLILRYRGNMSSPNTAMRDPTLFRIIKGNHPKVGSKYYLWPTYDFAAPIEDSLDGITHAFRTKEYELRNELYFTILDNLDLPKPKLIEFSRLEFEGIPVSKRKITPLIEKGIIKRWDDPRLPTLMGLRRRGIQPESIRKFVLSLSITLSETKPSIEILESFNRKILDPKSLRLFFVKNPIELHIDRIDTDYVELKNHPTNNMGSRSVKAEKIIYISNDDAIKFKTGDTVRLMDLCNIEVLSIENAKMENDIGYDNGITIFARNKGNDISHSIPKIQWVSKSDSKKFKVLKPLPLYNGDTYNEDNLLEENGLAESYISKLEMGTIIQFVRYGFCRIDDSSTAIFTHR